MTRSATRVTISLAGIALAVGLAGCGGSASTSQVAPSGPTSSSEAAGPPTSAEPAPQSPLAGPFSGPCDLLSDQRIADTLGVQLGAGEETIDEARQIQTCRWATEDLSTIVLVGVTDVEANEAYQTNFDLAPAYFEGDPFETTVTGAERAYAVEQPDVGWVVGVIANDEFAQVQVGGTDITQAMAVDLATSIVARLTTS